MKFLIVLVCFSLSSASLDEQWKEFKIKHGKLYRSVQEETLRRQIFSDNLDKIATHNEKYEKGLATFKLGVNKFADLSSDEFIKRNGYRHSKLRADYTLIPYVAPDNASVPDEFDWRTEGAVTPVKDQGSCGSCWTFSTTGTVEGQVFLKTGKLVSISEQNLVDCSTEEYDNYGCNGGDMPPAIQYIIDNDGVDSEETYPYEGRDERCRYVQEGNVTSAQAISIVDNKDEDLLKTALALVGPIAIAIDASNFDFQLYDEGVYYNENCLTEWNELDHAVLLVGYGVEDGVDYWLVKNSWAEDWGIDGYIKMTRNKDNNCGIATEPIFPIMY